MTNHFPVPQESVEAGLLNAINLNHDRWLALSQFTSDDFVSHRDVFQFMGQYLSQYAVLPSNSQLSTRFQWQPPIGEFQYWFVEMKRYALARRVLEVVQEGYSKISEPAEALATIVDKLSIIRSQQTNHIQASDSAALERLEKFDYRTQNVFENRVMIGIKTGMKIIDDTLVGWTPGSLVGVYARPGVGKTWWLIWQGVNAWMEGKTVLAITPEMPANMLNLRIDVMVGNALGHPIDYNKLIIGDDSIRHEYELVTEVMAQSNRWWTYDSLNDRPLSVVDIASLIRQHDPDIILVDGVSLLRAESRGQTWEQMKDICYGLKNLGTVYEKPILVTHQAVNSARGRRTEQETTGRGDDFLMPSLNDAAFGDAFVQACSDVITMVGEPTTPYVNWYSIRKHRERGWQSPLPSRMGLICDFGRGKLIDVGHLGYNPEAVGQEMRRILGR